MTEKLTAPSGSLIRLLLIDDNPDDRNLAAHELHREFPEVEITTVGTRKDFNRVLEDDSFDLVITDHHLGWSDGIRVLQTLKERFPTRPVIMFTGTGSEEIAVRAMKEGVDDYILKSPQHFVSLAAAVRASLERVEQRQALKRAETRYQNLFDDIPVGLFVTTLEGAFLEANPTLIDLFGYPDKESMLAANVLDLYANPDERKRLQEQWDYAGGVSSAEFQVRRRDSALIWVRVNSRYIYNAAGNVSYIEGSVTDITQRKQAQLEQTRLLEETRRQLDELTILHSVATASAQTLSEDAIIESATQSIGETLYSDHFGVLLLDHDEGVLRAHPSYRGIELDAKRSTIPLDKGISGKVASSGQPMRIADVSQHEGYLNISANTRSELCVPIKSGDRILGIINAESSQLDAFSQADERLLTTIAGQLGAAIENARLLDTTRQQLEELKVLHAIANAATEVTGEHELILQTIQIIVNTLRPQYFGILLLDERAQELRILPEYQAGTPLTFETIPLGQGITGTVAATGKTIRAPDVSQVSIYMEGDPLTRSELCVPIKAGNRILGVINSESKELDAFSETDEQLLATIASQLGTAIEKLRLFEAERASRKQAETLREVAAILGATTDKSTVLDLILEQLNRLVPYDSASIQILQGDRIVVEAVGGALEPEGQVGLVFYLVEEDLVIHPILKDLQPIVHGDVRQVPGWINVPGTEKVRSWIGAPLVAGGECIGVLTVDHYETNYYTEEMAQTAAVFANHAAAAFENARLFASTNEALAREQRLGEVARTISGPLDLDATIQEVGRLAVELVGADTGSIALVRADDHSPLGAYLFNPPENLEVQPPPKGKGLMWGILETGLPVLVSDYAALPQAMPEWVEAGAHGFIGVPLAASEGTIGVLGLFSLRPDKEFNERDLALVETVGRQAGIAIENAWLFEESQRQMGELSALYDIALATGSLLETETLIQHLYEQIGQTMHLDSFGAFLYDADSGNIEVISAMTQGKAIPRMVGAHTSLDQSGVIGWVMDNRQSYLINDVQEEEMPVEPAIIPKAIRSWLGIPLIAHDRLVGAVSVHSHQPNAFSPDNRRFLESLASQIASTLENARLYEELEDAFVQTVLSLANAMDVRDSYTNTHSQSLADMAEDVGRELGCDEEQLETLRWASLLHDIGKMGVPDDILLKPTELDELEWEAMRLHPEIGARIVAPVKKLASVAPIIRAHQERYDGSGYPDGLRGEEIPMEARILAVVDAYGAITDDRVYRPARSHEVALEELQRCSGTQFDPQVVEVFLEVIARGKREG